MSVLNLTKRITEDESLYRDFIHSGDSLVLIRGEIHRDPNQPGSIDLSIGESCYHSRNGEAQIPQEGILLRPGETAVVLTRQKIGVPLNLFGLLFGKGTLIFKGVFISPGKIDPGYFGELRIGIFNGGPEYYLLEKGNDFCSCCFFDMDSHQYHTLEHEGIRPKPKVMRHPFKQRMRMFFQSSLSRDTFSNLVRSVVAILALVVSLVALFKDPIIAFLKHLFHIKP
jgi:dCTP deaminase